MCTMNEICIYIDFSHPVTSSVMHDVLLANRSVNRLETEPSAILRQSIDDELCVGERRLVASICPPTIIIHVPKGIIPKLVLLLIRPRGGRLGRVARPSERVGLRI